jgi:hypothetical protein
MSTRKIDHDLALHHYRMGANDAQIADLLGNVGPSGVQYWRSQNGLPRNKSRALYWLKAETFQQLLSERQTLEAVSDALGVRSFTLYNWRKEQGLA